MRSVMCVNMLPACDCGDTQIAGSTPVMIDGTHTNTVLRDTEELVVHFASGHVVLVTGNDSKSLLQCCDSRGLPKQFQNVAILLLVQPKHMKFKQLSMTHPPSTNVASIKVVPFNQAYQPSDTDRKSVV